MSYCIHPVGRGIPGRSFFYCNYLSPEGIIDNRNRSYQFPFSGTNNQHRTRIQTPVPQDKSAHRKFRHGNFDNCCYTTFFSCRNVHTSFTRISRPRTINDRLVFFQCIVMRYPTITVFNRKVKSSTFISCPERC